MDILIMHLHEKYLAMIEYPEYTYHKYFRTLDDAEMWAMTVLAVEGKEKFKLSISEIQFMFKG